MRKTLRIQKYVPKRMPRFSAVEFISPLNQQRADELKEQLQRHVTLPEPPPVELELKLVQDTRINPDVVHLYVSGLDHPVMQFKIVRDKLTFHRITSGVDGKPNVKIEDTNGKGHFGIAETRDEDEFGVAFGWPSEREAFDEGWKMSKETKEIGYVSGGKMRFEPSAADLDAQVAQGGIVSSGKPRC